MADTTITLTDEDIAGLEAALANAVGLGIVNTSRLLRDLLDRAYRARHAPAGRRCAHGYPDDGTCTNPVTEPHPSFPARGI
jgi:hypothetical protein